MISLFFDAKIHPANLARYLFGQEKGLQEELKKAVKKVYDFSKNDQDLFKAARPEKVSSFHR
jgi:hypothetical protein